MLKRFIIGLLAWVVVVYAFQAIEAPERPFYAPPSLPQTDLLVSRNSIVGISYLPIIPEVRADVISEPIDYCGVAWLSNFWPDYLVRDAAKICEKESEGQQWRVNENWFGIPEISCGLFQINVLAHPEYTCEEMKDPEKNVLAAIKIYNNEGWKAWYNSAKKIGIIK